MNPEQTGPLTADELTWVRHLIGKSQVASEQPVVAEDVKRVRLEPGDTVVVTLAWLPEMARLNLIRDGLREAFPGHQVIVLPPGNTLETVRPTPAPIPTRLTAEQEAELRAAFPIRGREQPPCTAAEWDVPLDEKSVAAAIGIPRELFEAAGVGSSYASNKAAVDALFGERQPEPLMLVVDEAADLPDGMFEAVKTMYGEPSEGWADVIGVDLAVGKDQTAYTTTGATWSNPPGDILGNIKATIDKLKAETGYDRGPDVLVVHQLDVEKIVAPLEKATGYASPFSCLFGIPARVVGTNVEGLLLARELESRGKRVQLVGRLTTVNWDEPTEPAADTPVEARAR